MASPVVAGAQTPPDPPTLEPVVVTANRAPQPLSSVLGDVSLIDRDEIERSGAAAVADLLARLPGIEFARNGGPGSTTSVYIRGSESRHTAVYIDGVRVDSQSTGGAAWEQIPLEQIERIEVLRGPAAGLYGSDAVGGVVQLFTRRGEGALRPGASLAVGSQATTSAQVGVSGASPALDIAVSASHARSDGFNARTAPNVNSDADGWRRSSAHARVGYRWADRHRVEASLLASNLRAAYDGSAADDDISRHALRSGGLSWHGRWNDAAATQAQISESRSRYETRPSYYRTETTLRNVVIQHEQRLGVHVLSGIVERREDELLNPATAFSATLRGRRTQDGLMLGWRGELGDHALQAHLRHDHDSEFKGQRAGGLAWGWRFAPQWRASASAATSFRAPTLYQRFSEYGVATLKPESGRSIELGLRWAAAGSEAGVVAWRNRVEDLINFGAAGPCASAFGCYENVGHARYEGITLSGLTPWGRVALRGSFDWHDPRNVDTGMLLARRARRLATFGVDTGWAGWSLGAEVQAAGKRFDNAANTQRLGGYALLNLRASRVVTAGLTLEARVDNLADKHYELAHTYNTAGRTLQAGLRWTMR